MDKVQPENQSEHTPVGPTRDVASPRERRDPVVERPKPPAHSAKNNKSRRGQALGYNSPDRRQWIKSSPKIRASTRRWALRAMSRARSSRRDAVAPRPKPPAQRAKKQQKPARPGARLQFTGPPPMDKVQPENQSEHTPVGPTRDVASPLEPTRRRSSAAKAAGATCKKQQKPARPGARLQFTAPPPMDKVRTETQSEHTPEGPTRDVASPLEPTRRRSSAAKAAGATCKKTTKAGPARRSATIHRTAANG